MDRRRFLLTTALSGVGTTRLTACGGTTGSASADAVASDQTVWNIVPPPVLLVSGPDVVFDLQPSLPTYVRSGGSFGVAPTGAPLPPGVQLSSAGVLSVTSAAAVGTTTGVIFVYEEPG
jgi:hypothetical protein